MSPTDGTVVDAFDGYRDFAAPGQALFGNHLVIQRSDHEFLVLGSLGQHSATIGVGARVAAGQVVASCGFSGMRDHPGLDVQMRPTRDIVSADSPGLPMPFADLSVRTPGGCQPTSLLYRGQGTC